MTSPSPLLRAKVVLLGAPGVGKTSLIARFVHSRFSEAYQSTLGVKVDRKSVELEDHTVAMLIWDLHGEDKGLPIPASYMRGASAAVVVMDASRPETSEKAGELKERFMDSSPTAAVCSVANKSDLDVEWDVVDAVAVSSGLGAPARLSAKDGSGVNTMFESLARDMVASRQ